MKKPKIKRKMIEVIEAGTNGENLDFDEDLEGATLTTNAIIAEADTSLTSDRDMDTEIDSSENSFQNLKGIKLVTAVVKHPQEFCKKYFKSSNANAFSTIEEVSQTFLMAFGRGRPKSDNDNDPEKSDDKKVERFNRKLNRLSYAFSCESTLFKTFLKYGMRYSENSEMGYNLIDMIIATYSLKLDSIQNPILGIQMMLSHSKAEDIFLEKIQKPQKVFPAVKKENASNDLVTQNEIEVEPLVVVIDEKPKIATKLQDPEKYTIIKTSLLKLWTTMTKAFIEISKVSGTDTDKRILENSVVYLMQMYGGTMSPSDILVFDLLRMYTSARLDVIVETLPLFGPKCFEAPQSGASNPLYAHSMRANTILTCLSDTKAYHTALQFDPKKPATTSASYDFRFLLPLLCHILDERNICDGGKVISFGWIYFIVKGMSSDDLQIRSMSFLAYHRLIQCFQKPKAFRSKDNKIYLHFLTAVRRGVQELGDCKISHLLATWIIFVWEVLRQPSHSMFQRVTHFLFAKPIVEMTILPDFVSFYNDGDDNKESRTWILNVLYCGLKNREDWRIAQKSPIIKFLCASFILEKVKTKRTIVTILSRGAEIPEIAEKMVDKYSLPLWLSRISTTSNSLKIDLRKFFDNLVCNCPESETRNKIFEFVRIRLISTLGLETASSSINELSNQNIFKEEYGEEQEI